MIIAKVPCFGRDPDAIRSAVNHGPFAGIIESLQNPWRSRLAHQSFRHVPDDGKVLEPQRRAQTRDVISKAKKRWMASRYAIGHCRRCAKSRPSRRMRSHKRSAKHSGIDDMSEGSEAHAEAHAESSANHTALPLRRAELPWSGIEVLLPPSAGGRGSSSKRNEVVLPTA